MKNLSCRFAVLFLSLAVTAFGGTPFPGIDVVIKPSGGNAAVYQGKTDARGSFATAKLEPGAYVVEFTSKRAAQQKGSKFALAVAGGKERMEANGVAAEKFAAGGVAMKVEVAKPSKLTGQIATMEAAGAVPAGMETVRANVKVMNGKRYVWVPAAVGSNMGGRWEEEGSDAARLATTNKKGQDSQILRGMQDTRGTPPEPNAVPGGDR